MSGCRIRNKITLPKTKMILYNALLRILTEYAFSKCNALYAVREYSKTRIYLKDLSRCKPQMYL